VSSSPCHAINMSEPAPGVLRTPDTAFANLPQYSFKPH